MAALRTFRRPVPYLLVRLAAGLLALVLAVFPAFAADRLDMFVSMEKGFARMALAFGDRLDLPGYQLRYENNVLVIAFDDPVDVALPDIARALPDYVTVARLDPDGRNIRIGLRTKFNVSKLEAGEQLYIDLLPKTWQGLPPGLPPGVVAALAERAKNAAARAEEVRKAQLAAEVKPVANVRVGRNPTFMRIQFDWNTATNGAFTQDGRNGDILFDWPVGIDLYEVKAELPPELIAIKNEFGPEGSHVRLELAEGVKPRFYSVSDRQFVLDIDIATPMAEVSKPDPKALLAQQQLAEAETKPKPEADQAEAGESAPGSHQTEIVPVVAQSGTTVRVTFPFDTEVPAAVFRRGDTVWMLFDTVTAVKEPAPSPALDLVARDFSVVPSGDSQVVRLTLSGERLATLGSEGRSWVLSLGDMLLAPTEPITLQRRRDAAGVYEMTADLTRPGRVHQFRDPVVGDVLSVVTAFPPARGLTRSLSYVDFDALKSVHGLVIRPEHEDVRVALDQRFAIVRSDDGLTLSEVDGMRPMQLPGGQEPSSSYIDLASMTASDPVGFGRDLEVLQDAAARADGRLRDRARLDLARYYLANQFAYEALGVLRVMASDLKAEDLKRPMKLTEAAANTLADRPHEALSVLNGGAFSNEPDALIWRTIARTAAGEFAGARADAQGAEAVVDNYPAWMRARFLLAAVRAAIETGDVTSAGQFLSRIEFSNLDEDQASTYQLLTGRIAELEGHLDEALDTYGQVMASEVRPSRAEAVYRTLLILDQQGRIDVAKATETLASEALMWRGDALEANMQRLLVDLYFRNGDYRDGFQTVRFAVTERPDTAPTQSMLAQAKEVFGDLYLNGKADSISPVDALAIFYDFRNLTPPGARGDEMIRNLARRLVKVDLLPQAADLLRYQVDNRLKGVAQSQVAADVAVIEIADRRPQEALNILNRTRLAELSPSLDRQRRVLEARALIDAGRYDLALDFMSRLSGRDVELLRIDANWQARRYRQAAEALEVFYGNGGPAEPLSQPARMNIIKAAVGFVLADDRLGLARLREKFAGRMSQSAEWPMFDLVTSTVKPDSLEFKKVANAIASMDSINAFLAAYTEYYQGLGAVTPTTATRKENAV